MAARPAVALPLLAGSTSAADGLDSADVVYVELPTGGEPRLMALFQSRDYESVGPLGGLRPVDAKVLPVSHPIVGSGADYAKFVKMATAAGLQLASAAGHPEVYSNRSASGAAGVYASTSKLRALAARGTLPPPTLFPFATDGQPLATVGVKPVKRLSAPATGASSMSWAYDSKSQRWRTRVAGADVSAANVVSIQVAYKPVNAHFPRGPVIPSADMFGSGTAYVVSGPRGAAGHWAHPGAKKLVTVNDSANVPMRLRPGPTWVLMTEDAVRAE